MKLCEHLEKIYQNEIRKGNEVLAIGIGYETGIKLSVFFKYAMVKKYDLPEGIRFGSSFDTHYPIEHYYICDTCKMALSFPMEEGQAGNYEPSPFEVEDPTVLVSEDTVLVLDETSRTGVKPTIID